MQEFGCWGQDLSAVFVKDVSVFGRDPSECLLILVSWVLSSS